MSSSGSEESEDEFESADEGDESQEESKVSGEESSTEDDNLPAPSEPVAVEKSDEKANIAEPISYASAASKPESSVTQKEDKQDIENTKRKEEINESKEPLHCPDLQPCSTADSKPQPVENKLSHQVLSAVDSETNKLPADDADIQPVASEIQQHSTAANDSHIPKPIVETAHTQQVSSDVDVEPIKPVLKDAESLPVAAPGKSATRNISARERKPKPSLGAKKLGAVKSTQPSDAVLAAFNSLDVEEQSTESKRENSSFQDNSSSNEPQSDGGKWGWFAPPKSLMNSVSSLTNQIISTVENGLNIPEPEDLAKEDYYAEKTREKEDVPVPPQQAQESGGFTQLFGGVSNITRFVESTGSSIFSTGLDTLELLGKRTINALQQTDPGLQKTKAVLINPLKGSQDRPCLSQVLREAKDRTETAPTDVTDSSSSNESAPTLMSLFDLHHGLAHLEALEMLSQQCQTRNTPQLRRLTAQRRAIVDEIAAICSRTDDSEDSDNSDPGDFDLQTLEQNLSSSLDKIGLELPLQKLMDAFREGVSGSFDIPNSPLELYARALESLALVTSSSVELLHKSAELILMATKSPNPAAGGRMEAETFHNITSVLAGEILRLGSHHANQIVWAEKKGEDNYSTDIFYEASNCRLYLLNALKLTIPVLQSRIF